MRISDWLKRSAYVAAVFLVGAVALFLCVPPVLAETRVGGTISGDAVWTATDSPYVLDDDLIVPAYGSLRLEPGVSVISDPSLDWSPSISVFGRLEIAGDVQSRVSVTGIDGIRVDSATATIAYADIHTANGISLRSSHSSVSHSVMSGGWSGIYVMSGSLSVDGSRFADNDYGVMNASTAPVYPVRAVGGSHIAFIGSASPLALGGYPPAEVHITDSSFVSNHIAAIRNEDAATVHAENDWWGSPSGPAEGDISGPVSFTPWLDHDLTAEAEAPCCSSILFIPGIEGTRLYVDQASQIGWRLLGRATTTNRLWEPNDNADVAKLYMKADGKSADPTVYSGTPIDKALGLFDIYGGFMDFLDELVGKGTVNEWRAFGYDWRKPIADVVSGLEKKATTTQSLIGIVESMASSSKTGKVSIVAHSNGGLVAKYLVKTLADMGKASLIDSVVSVAVPFLGTPAAIPALLYGDGQSIAWGLVATQANAQGLAQNMPSAYSLLPSAGYFNKTTTPTIVSSSTMSNTASVQKAFLSAAGSNSLLLNAAEALHAVLDPFVWPATIATWAVAGWGKDTIDGLKYSEDGSRQSLKDSYGDGTVASPSAADHASQVISEDLRAQSTLEKTDISHGNILEASTTQALVEDLLDNPAGSGGSACADNPAVCNTKVLSEISRLPGVTIGPLDWNSLIAAEKASKKELYVTVHSPVALNVYDSQGRHTGELPMPTVDLETGEPIEPGLYKRFEAEIPGSDFSTNSGDDYITLPDDGQTYTIAIQGTDVGTFGLEIGRERATSTVETIEWTDVPVTPLSSATTTIVSDSAFNAADTELASSTALLRLDIDGDNIVDATSSVGQFDQSLTPDLMDKACRSFGRGASKCNGLANKVKHAKDILGLWKRSHHGLFNLKASHEAGPRGYIGHLILKGLKSADKDAVIDRMDDLLDRFQMTP